MSISSYYKLLGTFKRYDGSLDSLGAPDLSTDNFDNLHVDIPCLLRPMGSDEKIKRDKTVSDRMFYLYCENLAIRESDIVIISGTTYSIYGFKNPNSLAHHLEVEIEEIV